MAPVRFLLALLGSLGVAEIVAAHSAMFCVKYNNATKTCIGYPRYFDARREIGDGYMGNGNAANPCAVANSIGFSTRYALYNDNFPMGSAKPGEVITLMWPARNHAVANQDPQDNIITIAQKPYSGSLPDRNIPASEMFEIGRVPFMSSGANVGCEGGNGNENICTGSVTIPTNLTAGVYQLVWNWKNIYSTCGDINVVTSNAATSPAASPSSSRSPSGANTGASPSASPSTGASASPSPSPSGATSGATAKVSFNIAWRGGSGWGASVTVSSTSACSTWSVSFDLATGLSVTQSWNSELSSSGQTFTFKSLSYNGLTAGGSQSFGFNGARSSDSQEITFPTNWEFVCDGAKASIGSSTQPLEISSDENADAATSPYGEFVRSTSDGPAKSSYLSSTVIGVVGVLGALYM